MVRMNQFITALCLLAGSLVFSQVSEARLGESHEEVPCAHDKTMALALGSDQERTTSSSGTYTAQSRVKGPPLTKTMDELEPIVIPVIFQILRDDAGVEGHVPWGALQRQIDHANNAYAGMQRSSDQVNTKITFVLQAAHYWDDSDLFENCETLDFETLRIRDLQANPTTAINLFTCKMNRYSGWAHACYCDEQDNYLLLTGANVDYRFFPSYGDWDPLKLGGRPQRIGDTFVHEVGHSLGLLHPSNGGCTVDNDYVEDTPAQATTFGTWDVCPTDMDTCPTLPGKDMVQNFMDYADDQCRDTFTEGQVHRMHWYIDTYLPTLRSMSYSFQCLAKVLPNASNKTEVAYSLCKSACFNTRTPGNTNSPANGWCYHHGGSALQNGRDWGECVCSGTPVQQQLLPMVPATSKRDCKGSQCAVAFWSLNGECVPPMTWAESAQFCTKMGYKLCSANDVKSGRVARATQGTPCEKTAPTVWSRMPCGRAKKAFRRTAKNVFCMKKGKATPVCCT